MSSKKLLYSQSNSRFFLEMITAGLLGALVSLILNAVFRWSYLVQTLFVTTPFILVAIWYYVKHLFHTFHIWTDRIEFRYPFNEAKSYDIYLNEIASLRVLQAERGRPYLQLVLENKKINLPMPEGIFFFAPVLRHLYQPGIHMEFPSKYQAIQSYVEGQTDELAGKNDTETP